MSSSKRRPGTTRPRRSVTSKSGKTIPLNTSFGDRAHSRRIERAAAKATYLSTLPKDRWKRMLYRLHPQRLARYWFSRDGAIMALRIIGIGIVACFLLTIGVFAYFRKDLPNIKDISGDKLGGSITYYDKTGQTVLWQDYDAIKRVPVTSDNISPYMKEATVSIEDKDFYKHGAFDVRGLMRAAAHDVFGGGGSVQGGSTITQQLVKLNEQWTNNRTVTRKVKELILAVELEREYSKNDILTGYLNIAPYGGVEYGCESAAQDYFHTSCKNLTLAQASMLAAVPQSPSYYSPYGSTRWNSAAGDTFSSTALLDRQHYILDQMTKQGYITQAQADQARAVDVLAQVQPLQSKYDGIKAPWFVLSAKQQLEEQFKASTSKIGGWKVITTLDLNLQTEAEKLVAQNLWNVKAHNGDEEAAVGEDVQTGQIVSLVGGATDFLTNQNNFANNILIPPGSSFKPYDYSTLIDNNNNVGAGSVLYDAPKSLPGYSGTCKQAPLPDGTNPCQGDSSYLYDFDHKFPGPITIRYALGDSRNVPAATAMAEALPTDKSTSKTASINKVLATATAMMDNTQDINSHQNSYNCYADEALTKVDQCGLASSIGDGAYLHLDDHVNGLATLARMGQAIPRTFILQITDSSNKNIYKWTQPKGNQVIKADTAYILNNMASDPNASYLGGSCTTTNCTGYKFHRYNGWDFAIKTGTTNNNYDGLMTSWSTKYAFVSWVGSQNRNKALSEEMEYLTEPITKGWMEFAHQGLKPANWTQPADIKTLPAFVVRNHVYPGDKVPSTDTDLFPSWYAGGNKENSSQTIDKVSGKLATSCTPASAKQTAYNSNAASWNADIFMGGHNSVGSDTSTNSAPTATDDVHNCSDSPPSITLTASDCTSSCTFQATVTQGTHLLTDPNYPQFPGTVTFTVNGQQACSSNVSSSPSTVACTYNPTSSGSGNVTATVTDSVLYSASDSATVNFTLPQQNEGNQITITSPQGVASGGTVTISWSGGSGSGYSATVSGKGFSQTCTGTSSCPIDMSSASAGQTYTATVTDSANNQASKPFTYSGR